MKHCRLRLLKFLACLAALIGIEAGAAAENLRYLFLIDHSPNMATRQIATVETIYYLVRTGFENQIQPGEKFALWFYGSRLQTNAALTWQPDRKIELARNAANLFTGRIYSRIPPRARTLADAAPFIAASPRITVFIFTDGSQPLSGTPYDTAINNAIENHRAAFLRDDKPFIITLTARNGEWIGGYIHTDLSQRFKNPEIELPSDLLNKALVAVRATPTTQTNNPAEIDKARDVLRDALAGKTKLADTNAPIPVAALQLAPSLKEPPPETLKEQPKREEPKVEKSQPQVAVVPPLIAAPKPQEQKTEPPPQNPEPTPAKPVEVASVPSPSPASANKTAEPPPVVREEPKPAINEQPKPIIREEPKTITKTATASLPELPKELPQKPVPSISSVSKPPAESEKKESNKSAATSNTVTAVAQSKTPPAKSSPPIQTAILAPPHKPFPLPILVAGLFTIGIAGAVLLRNARRRAKSPGSIITQALPHPGEPLHRK